MTKRKRVLVTPREIAGVASGLQYVLTERGHHVDVLLRWNHPFAYPVRPFGASALRPLLRAVREDEDARCPRLRRLLSLAIRIALLPVIAIRYDAVVYVGPDTLIGGAADRRLFKRLGLTTVTMFCGTDARPPYLDGWYAGASTSNTLDDVRAATIRTRQRVQLAERDSTYVINAPGCAQFHLSRFLDWTVVGFAQRPTEGGQGPRPDRATTRPLRILHAPSDPRMKGTEQIRAAIDAIGREGVAVEYQEITGRSHAEVQQLLRTADLVIDQLYSDIMLPGLATEAAHAATAVLVCGYAGDLVQDAARRSGAPSDHYGSPDTLLPVLRAMIGDHGRREALANSLHEFVSTGHWSVAAIGARWDRIISGDADAAWFDEPADFNYSHGWAISEADLVAFLRRYIARFGVPGLEMSHRPDAVAALVALSQR